MNKEETGVHEAVIQNIVNKALHMFSEKIEKVIKEAYEEVLKDAKLYTDTVCKTCKAYVIYSSEDNVEAFYDMKKEFGQARDSKTHYQWVIGLLATTTVALALKVLGVY